MGDNGFGIIFPQFTVCDYDFTANNPILKKCNNGSHYFLSALANCLSNDLKFSLTALNESLQYDRRLFINNLTLVYGEFKSISLETLSEEIWSISFHRRFGLCYTLDLSRTKDYHYVDLNQHDANPELHFSYLPDTHPWKWITVLLHTNTDMPDAMRSTFTPIFTSGKMKAMMVFVQETCKRLINKLDYLSEKKEAFELRDLLGKYSMDTIASCAFGVDAQAFTNKDSKFVQYADRIFKNAFFDGIKLFMIMTPFNIGVYILLLLKQPFWKKNEAEFFYNVILDSLKQRRESKMRRNDLIDMMVDAVKGEIDHEHDHNQNQFEKDAKLNHVTKKGEFDELVIVATAVVLLVAGYDTTGTTMAYACYQLAKNPEVQERLREEIEDVHGGDLSEDIKYDALHDMTYLDQVICETLCFHNPAGVNQRNAHKDYKGFIGMQKHIEFHLSHYKIPQRSPHYYKVPGHDLIIQKDVQVWINVVAVHMDPKHYPDPYVWNPDQFSKEVKAKRHPYAFLPFGEGQRNCIGMRFALMEAKLGLANIVRRYNLLPSDKTVEPLQLNPQSGIAYVKGGLHIKVEKRF